MFMLFFVIHIILLLHIAIINTYYQMLGDKIGSDRVGLGCKMLTQVHFWSLAVSQRG